MRSTASLRTSRRHAALLALALAPLASPLALAVSSTGQLNTYNGSVADGGLTDGANWTPGTPVGADGAGAYADLLFTTAPTGSLFTGGGDTTNIHAESYNVTNGAAYTLQLNTATSGSFRAGATSTTGTAENITGFTNSVSTVAQDLIYLSGGSSLTFNAANTSTGTPTTFAVRQAGRFNIGAGSTLTFNTAIEGSFALTLTGAGTTVLNAASSSTASTIINGGTLRYGLTDALATGPVVVGGGTLDLQTFNDTVGTVTLSSGSITGSGTLTATSYSVTGSGSISANLAGASGTSSGLTIQTNAGTLTLGGTNTYSGITYANFNAAGGNLIANSTGALSPTSQYRTAAAGANAGTLQLGVAGSYQMASLNLNSVLTVTGPASGAATLTFANGGILSGSGTKTAEAGTNVTLVLGSAGTATTLDIVGATATDRTLALRGNGNIVVNSVLRDASTTTFKGGIDKQGSGTATLTAANTYTRSTTVTAGTLLVNNTTGSGTGTTAVSAIGGTLGGSGFISGATTIASVATLAPGSNGNGTLTLENGLSLDGAYAWEINANNVSTGFDSVALTGGNLTLGATATFQITALSGVNFTDAFWTTSRSWTVVNNSGSGSITGTFAGGATGLSSNAYGAFSLAYGAGAGGDVTLLWTPATLSPFASWQITWFGSTTAPEAAAGADPDGDGQTNASEQLAGTNPTDPNSRFAVTIAAGSGALQLSWPSVVGQTYQVQTTDDLAAGPWTSLGNFTAAATNSTYSPSATASPRRFFRVVTPAP